MNLVHDAEMNRLPPFDALVAFDAACRHRSMTRAGVELGVTQSAVSHRVRRLEAYMGASLLRRLSGGVQPTEAGEALAAGFEQVIEAMASLRARCAAATPARPLRLGVAAPLVDHWLARRLPAFATAFPEITVELEIVDNDWARRGDLDLRILWTPVGEARTLSTQAPLFREKVFPVCHPALVSPGFVAGDPGVLKHLPLLQKTAAGGERSAEWEWDTWFERLGLGAPSPPALRFTSIGPALGAALAGAGAVMARSMLVHDALADGRLVRLLPPAWDLPSSKAHIVRWPGALRTDGRVRAFSDWLIDQARLTTA